MSLMRHLVFIALCGLIPSLALAQQGTASAADTEAAGAEVDPEEQARRTQEARSLYDAGTVAFADGRFEDARRRWREAYELTGLPSLRYNIGMAEDRLNLSAAAIASYEAYLQDVPDAENRNYVQRRLELLREQQPQDSDPVDPVDPIDPDVGDAADPIEAPVPERQSSGANIGAITLLAVGGGALVGGFAMGMVARGRYNDLDDTCLDGVCPASAQSDIDGVRRAGLSADILYGVGGAMAVGGLIWLLVGGGDDDSDSQAVRVDAGPGGVAVRGQF